MKSELLLSARTPQGVQDGLREVLESCALVVRPERPDQHEPWNRRVRLRLPNGAEFRLTIEQMKWAS